MNFEFILGKFETVKRNSNGSYNVSCPLPAHKHGDKRPSLTITEKEDKILLFCHVCGESATPEILKVVGLEEKYLFKKNWNKEEYSVRPVPVPGNNGKSHTIDYIRNYYNPVEAEYDYFDEKGNLTDKKLRHKKKGYKDFAFCHPVGNGKWDFKKSDIPGLHGLLEIIEAKKRGVKLFGNPEGEKDADTLLKIGIPSFTSGGVNTFKEKHIEILNKILNKDDTVLIFWDYDNGGMEDKEDRIKLYSKAIFKIKAINLPGLIIKENHGEDITDWLQAGHTKEELQELVKNTSVYIHPADVFANITGLDYNSAISQENKIENNWIVKDLFARGVNFSVLFGEPGVCKTWLILSEFLKLADGKNIFGKYETEPKKTVLLEADFPANVFEYRMKRLYKPENVDNFRMYSADELQEKGFEYCMDTEKGRETIEKLMEREKPDILIIDSLGSWIQGDEVKQDVIKPVIEFLKHISHKFNLHILLIHHPRKRSNVERLNRLLDMSDATGSFLLARYASAIYTVNGIHDEEGRVENKGLVINVKNWFKTSPKFEFSMEENEDKKMEFTFEYDEFSSFSDKKTGARQAIIENLKNNIEGLTKKQLVNYIPNVSQETIVRALRELKQAGKIIAIGITRSLVYKLKPFKSDTSDTQYIDLNDNECVDIYRDNSSQGMTRNGLNYCKQKFNSIQSISSQGMTRNEALQDIGKDSIRVNTCVCDLNDEKENIEQNIKCSNCDKFTAKNRTAFFTCEFTGKSCYPMSEHSCNNFNPVELAEDFDREEVPF